MGAKVKQVFNFLNATATSGDHKKDLFVLVSTVRGGCHRTVFYDKRQRFENLKTIAAVCGC